MKKGFTLAEILIMLVTVGIISALSIATVSSQKTNFSFSCYHFLRDFSKVIGYMAATTSIGSIYSFSCERAYEVSTAQYSDCIVNSENAHRLNYSTDAGFCNGLAQTLSAASTVSCSSFQSATLDNIYGGISSSTTPNFRLLNKYSVYISSKQTPSTGLPYRIVTVDLNGGKEPNKTAQDIISFGVFDNGEVLPLGIAADDTKYFKGLVKIKTNSNTDVKNVRHPSILKQNASKKYLTFRDAYCRASGNSSSAYPSYCDGVANSETAKSIYNTSIAVSNCSNTQNYTCDYSIVKPFATPFFTTMEDVYSTKNDDVNENIYKY